MTIFRRISLRVTYESLAGLLQNDLRVVENAKLGAARQYQYRYIEDLGRLERVYEVKSLE